MGVSEWKSAWVSEATMFVDNHRIIEKMLNVFEVLHSMYSLLLVWRLLTGFMGGRGISENFLRLLRRLDHLRTYLGFAFVTFCWLTLQAHMITDMLLLEYVLTAVVISSKNLEFIREVRSTCLWLGYSNIIYKSFDSLSIVGYVALPKASKRHKYQHCLSILENRVQL